MSDQYVVLRPNRVIVRSNCVTQAITVPTGAECADNSDSTYVLCPVLDAPKWIVYGLGTFAFPANSRITCLYPIVRVNSIGGAGLVPGTGVPLPYTFMGYCQYGSELGPYSAQNVYAQGWQTLGCPAWYEHNSGVKFTPDEINDGNLWLSWQDLTDSRAGVGSYKYAGMSEVYVYVYYNQAPVATVTGPVEGSTVTTTNSPGVIWTSLDPEGDAQSGYQVKIFSDSQYGAAGFDPTTSAAVINSGDISGAAVSFGYSTALDNNTTFRAYVRTRDAIGFGPWDYNQFSIITTPPGTAGSTQPGAPVLVVTEESTLARVKLDISEGTSPTIDWFTIERSEDNGATWTKVRDASPLLNPNLVPLAASEMEAVGASGWTATNQVATYPQSSIAQLYSGLRSLQLRAASAADMEAYSPWYGVVPATLYRARAWSFPGTTARNFQTFIRWSADGVTWSSSTASPAVTLEVAASWRENVTGAIAAPAGMFFASVMVRWTGPAINEDHFLDTVALKLGANKIVYDNEVNRRLPAGMLKYRAQGFRYSSPTEAPLVTTTATPYTANVAGQLTTDDSNWLKSPSNPALNVKVRFGFESGDKWEFNATETQAVFAPKGRGTAVVFGSNTEVATFDLPLVFLSDTEFQAFEVLRKRREKLLLQTRYGDTSGAAFQLWIQLGDRRARIMNTSIQGDLMARKVTVRCTRVDAPPATIVFA